LNASFIRHVASTVGISIVQQFVGLGRQALIAAYYGLSREFDGYLVVYAVATIAVFNLSSVFDTVAVSRLVQTRQRDGEGAFWRSSNRLLLQSSAAGLIFAGGFLVVLQLVLPIVAAGFGPSERALLTDLAVYFTPWLAIVIPYYAVSAHLKALWRFHWVFGAELLAIVISIVVLLAWHDSIICLPVAYGAGYLGALIVLLAGRGFARGAASSSPSRLMRGMANQYLANQTGSLAGLVDRYFQSFLTSGGISALGYTGQIVNNLSSMLTFREIYVTPLAAEAGRDEKLARMMCGVVLLSVPISGFVIAFAEPIVRILFERGNFTAEATALTASVMQIMALSLLFTPVLAPMERLFQILNRISYSYLRNLFALIVTAIFQSVLVFRLGWDVYGIAWASVATSAAVTIFVAYLVWHCGVMLRWRAVLVHAGLATAISVAALAASIWVETRSGGLVALILGSALYWGVIAAGYLLIRDRLRAIIG
jgi:putative peptidoglycan lipid II flippase